jgi:hypothetical protein
MIRFGIAGFGLHAVKRLMPGFVLARNCRVTALSTRDLVKAQESARHYNIPQSFTSTAELCRSSEVDAVFVATPNSVHLADVLTAIDAGKPVLCEKPMGISAAECRHMVEAARKANLQLGVVRCFDSRRPRPGFGSEWQRDGLARQSLPEPNSRFLALAITPACGCTIKRSQAAVRLPISEFIVLMRYVTSCKMRLRGLAHVLFRTGVFRISKPPRRSSWNSRGEH